MLNGGIYLILTIILLGFVTTLLLVRRWLREKPQADPILTDWLRTSTSQINQRLDTATQLMAYLQKNIGEMTEFGKGIKEIHDFLQSPKLRGNLGETILGDMLKDILPSDLFHLQYSFKSGVRVDAAIITNSGLLCIDSKFPMPNFRQIYAAGTESDREQARRNFYSDVKKHISSISEKYLHPDEGTVDIAFMYIPSESVFYEIASSSDLTDFASDKRVIPVSPATLYAYLKGILMAYQSKQLQEKSFEILKLIKGIQKDYAQVGENIGVLNRHLTNAYNQMGHVSTTFSSLGTKLAQTQDLSDGPVSDINALK